ncbi:DUF1707 and DUF4190 domain-containing protein [Nocardia mexicana]|uniref:Uncharacterized protein DUF4190 n=1 Tax=Nocardia mexicana TaxID=279262 RepID=A0A370GXR3_9NOCA|nr:DUF1707 and DUF4190 domain-containing protein [Nocardia mexicana]RDI48442.1 uncharacterized protein DUF4190 [Nocardia mexicana]
MGPQWAGGHFLAGDADRELAVEGLKQNFQAGRITAEELSERIGQALNARTFGDLDRTMVGLPWARPNSPVFPGAPYAGPGMRRRQRGLGITAFVLGVCGFICGITAVPAVVLGVVALAIDTERDDKGFAIAGVAVGALWMAIFGWFFFT